MEVRGGRRKKGRGGEEGRERGWRGKQRERGRRGKRQDRDPGIE